MNKLGVAVIGVGFWGRNHARILRELPETNMVAVCDKDSDRVRSIAEQYGIEGYTDSRKLLKQKGVEAVTVCTWSTNLAEEARRALKAAKHVLVEKPMADNSDHARKLVELAKEKRLHLAVGFVERFNPGVQRVKEAIKKREVGSPVSATSRRVSQWPERVGDIGVVKDTAIHDIDAIRYIFEEEPMAVYAKAGNLKHERFEDYAQIMLTFESGKTAFIESNWLTPYKVRTLIVTGSEAIMSLDYITQEITIETLGKILKPMHEWKEPLKLELQNFASSVLKDEEPLVTGFDGLRALEIAEAALKSAASCRAIKL